MCSHSSNNSIVEDKYIDYAKMTIDRVDNKITEYQAIGLFLEIPTYEALREIGIRPYALHNPFNKDYAKDQHLGVDLIFIYNGLLYGVECKNLSFKSVRNEVDYKWIDEEIIDRFDTYDSNFNRNNRIDRRVIVISHSPKVLYNRLESDPRYIILEVGYQAQYGNSDDVKVRITNLFSGLLYSKNPGDNLYIKHGYNDYSHRSKKMKYIQTRLHESGDYKYMKGEDQ